MNDRNNDQGKKENLQGKESHSQHAVKGRPACQETFTTEKDKRRGRDLTAKHSLLITAGVKWAQRGESLTKESARGKSEANSFGNGAKKENRGIRGKSHNRKTLSRKKEEVNFDSSYQEGQRYRPC